MKQSSSTSSSNTTKSKTKNQSKSVPYKDFDPRFAFLLGPAAACIPPPPSSSENPQGEEEEELQPRTIIDPTGPSPSYNTIELDPNTGRPIPESLD